MTIDGKEYQLAINNGPNHLHGGLKGFNTKVWTTQILGDTKISLSCASKDGEENYPGRVDCMVSYELTSNNELKIHYNATTTKNTPINLTNHAYFNLRGEGNPDIKCHQFQILTDFFCPTGADCLVTGEIKSVQGTDHDLREFKSFANLLEAMEKNPCDCPSGYDNNYCFGEDSIGKEKVVARAYCPVTGINLETVTTQPGCQFYTANFLNQKGKGGKNYGKHSSFCFETQGYPDAVNKKNFPSVILKPGEKYDHLTIYRIL